MVNCLDEIISEAKCCSATFAHKWINGAVFGNEDKQLWFDYMRLNAYIRTLERNKTKVITKKETIYVLPEKVNLNSLQRNKNSLSLEPEPKVICTEVEIKPCLEDSEVLMLIEEIRLLCSNCNCNCS